MIIRLLKCSFKSGDPAVKYYPGNEGGKVMVSVLKNLVDGCRQLVEKEWSKAKKLGQARVYICSIAYASKCLSYGLRIIKRNALLGQS